MYINMCP